MKYLIISLVVLSSCTKTWDCTIVTNNEMSGSTTHYYELKGTKAEAEEYEATGTNTYNGYYIDFDTSYSYTITQTTECK